MDPPGLGEVAQEYPKATEIWRGPDGGETAYWWDGQWA